MLQYSTNVIDETHWRGGGRLRPGPQLWRRSRVQLCVSADRLPRLLLGDVGVVIVAGGRVLRAGPAAGMQNNAATIRKIVAESRKVMFSRPKGLKAITPALSATRMERGGMLALI